MKKSIALACILKDEVNNLPQLMASVRDCFDEIHFTDTGSTDGSIELIQSWINQNNPANSQVFLHHFKWINDFAAARNASFDPVTTDYIMWMDLDDVLSDREKFIQWRDNVMDNVDLWIATYNYAQDEKGNSRCSFARERVIKRSLGFKWKYFVHEGIVLNKPIQTMYVLPWEIVHKRTEEDHAKDKSRNLNMFEARKPLDGRMQYYYGKELFENQMPIEAYTQLVEAAKRPQSDLELHDRIMAMQYACYAAMQLNQPETAQDLALKGLMLDPERAEFFVIIGDCLLKRGKNKEAIPYYSAATKCTYNGENKVQGALFIHKDSYLHYPRIQLARAYAACIDMDRAEESIREALKLGPNAEAEQILREILDLKEKAGLTQTKPKAKTEDVVFSCLPHGPYEWDEEIYKNKGIGGSETACVEMAHWIGKLTKRRVLVFNNKKTPSKFENVSYLPAEQLPKYFSEYIPKVNISWRHNVRLTEAPNYLWCHDLVAMGVENHQNFSKVIALSNFHKKFLRGMIGTPEEKIWVSRNGINPERFKDANKSKQYAKVIFSSSPDRGLDNCIHVMEQVVKVIPEAELHCFYGFENMEKLGKHDDIKRYKELIDKNSFVKFHGNVTQSRLKDEMCSSQVWLYPTNFQETFCITALEALACGAYPVVRSFGALPDTLKNATCDLIDAKSDRCDSQDDIDYFALRVIDAIQQNKHERVSVNLDKISWESVAKDWIAEMGL